MADLRETCKEEPTRPRPLFRGLPDAAAELQNQPVSGEVRARHEKVGGRSIRRSS